MKNGTRPDVTVATDDDVRVQDDANDVGATCAPAAMIAVGCVSGAGLAAGYRALRIVASAR